MMTDPASGGDSRHSQLPPLLRQAVIAHEAGQLDTAYPLYRRFVDENANHPTALQLLGLLQSQRGEYESAIALMRESLRLFPGQAEVANNLGNALYRSGRIEEAIESYSEATRIYPKYLEALRNLGLGCLETNRYEEAANCFRRCVEIRPDDPVSWLSLGNVQQRQDDFEAAIPHYRQALALRPDYADAHHNLGVCLRMKRCPHEALQHYRTARSLGLDRAELHHNLGNALADIEHSDGAIDAYRAALKQNPADLETHRNLNALLWQQQLLDDYLKSYQDALARQSGPVPLRLAYARALNRNNAFEDAQRLLEQGLSYEPDSSELKSLLAHTLEGQGRWTDALRIHAEAVNSSGSNPHHRISYARALLANQRPEEALQQAKSGAVQIPFDQRALAYLGLCWRMLGDTRDRILNDYEKLVRVYDLPVPGGYADAETFNERLSAVLSPLHIVKCHPAGQVPHGGTQTSGDLFHREEPEIAGLIAALKTCIQDYIAQFPPDLQHPLFSRLSESYDFAASRSVRLARNGYHRMHVHPHGWISSACFVEVPSAVAESDAHGGGLTFGQPDIDIGAHGEARRSIQPAGGQLVLFPSYMWHGFVPFESDEPGTTVSFDVVPV